MKTQSDIFNRAVEQLSSLPGVGKKMAFRLAVHLLQQEKHRVDQFAQSILSLKSELSLCDQCFNVTEHKRCSICTNASRNSGLICVVESVKEVVLFENTHLFKGTYHVLGGVLSPMDGIGPSDIYLKELVERCTTQGVEEIILALNPTLEGDTTQYYIYNALKDKVPTISTLARGVSYGEQIEYTDEATLGKSFMQRLSFLESLKTT